MRLKISWLCILLFGFFQIFTSCSLGRSALGNKNGEEKNQFRVATYNIRVAAKADEESGNGWSLRKKPLADVILSHGFDIVGTQEGNDKQLIELKELLGEYEYVSHPYGGRDGKGHNNATYYKASQFSVVDTGVFWFSETPDVPSIGWDASDRRVCSWVKFIHRKSGDEFYFFNAHLYWRLEIAKRESGPLLVDKIKEIAGDVPAICVGDFNSTPETVQIKAVKSQLFDAYDISRTPRKGVDGTNLGGGNFLGPEKGRIDYIFVSKGIGVKDYEVYSDRYNMHRYPSDHLPVSCLVSF